MIRLFLLLFIAFIAAPNLSAQSTIFLVRHAEKASNDAKDPDLSEVGRARAEGLAKTLKDANITVIYVTEFKRTQQTAEPLLRALHMRDDTVVSAKETEALVTQLRAVEGNTLLVGHSNTLPDIIKAFGISDSISIADNDYDDLFIIWNGTPAKLLHLHYH
ncbi:MAG: histidine phosphatase family protein [Verrucomicrobiota bacterium]|nr:histidine phosphatase family protein [Verrucomicrobiota bacterium]